jgi:signal transduction histidine kinase
MRQQITQQNGIVQVSLGWLRARLFPSGVATMMFAAYAMVLAGLLAFVLNQQDLPAFQFYLGILALAGMFVLQVVLVDLELRIGELRAGMLHLAANGALWLLVTWLSLGSVNFSFAPFLLFMLVGQAVVALPAWGAVLYTLALLGGSSALFWLKGLTLSEIATNQLSLSAGLVFVVVFSIVLKLYRAQTDRAEALLAQLTDANAQLQVARERDKELAVAEERVRLARDIHDGLGHHLTALSVQLQAAARLIDRDPARAAAAIAISREVAQAALDEVRQSVSVLRRIPLDGQSLPDALATLAAEFGRRVDVQTNVTVMGEQAELTPAAAQTLYRAAQEGLTNAHKHGAARSVQLTLTYAPGAVTLIVADDGTATSVGGTGFGLAGLRERAEQLGGSLSAGPRANNGYTLALEIPTGLEQGQP